MRGQIKMFETVGVLIVFFFLLITGSLFYFSAQKSALDKEKVAASQQFALEIVLKALYMPELDCSFLVTQKDNCIDKIKLSKLAALVNESDTAKQDYFTEFGYATIRVSEKYPERTSQTVLYENKPTEVTGQLSTLSPILIYDPKKDEYDFGVMEVVVYV